MASGKSAASGSVDSSQTSPQSRWPVAECRASLSAQPEANPYDWQSIKGQGAVTSMHNTNDSRIPCGGRMEKHQRQIRRAHRCVILMKHHRLCQFPFKSCLNVWEHPLHRLISARFAKKCTTCSFYFTFEYFITVLKPLFRFSVGNKQVLTSVSC